MDIAINGVSMIIRLVGNVIEMGFHHGNAQQMYWHPVYTAAEAPR
jgi:hypothetical protein